MFLEHFDHPENLAVMASPYQDLLAIKERRESLGHLGYKALWVQKGEMAPMGGLVAPDSALWALKASLGLLWVPRELRVKGETQEHL